MTGSSVANAAGDGLLTVRHVRHRTDLEVCILAGEVDLSTLPLLQRLLDDTEQRQVQRVIVDLSRLEFLSLSGVQALFAAAEQARATHRQFTLVVRSRPVRRALELAAPSQRIAVHELLCDAMHSLAEPRSALTVAS